MESDGCLFSGSGNEAGEKRMDVQSSEWLDGIAAVVCSWDV